MVSGDFTKTKKTPQNQNKTKIKQQNNPEKTNPKKKKARSVIVGNNINKIRFEVRGVNLYGLRVYRFL